MKLLIKGWFASDVGEGGGVDIYTGSMKVFDT